MIVNIKNFKVYKKIGVYDWEQEIDREIIINLKIETDYTKSLFSDDLKDAIDYHQITEIIKNLINKKSYKLIESMANDILSEIMKDVRIKNCQIEVDKVGAVENLDSFSVILSKVRL